MAVTLTEAKLHCRVEHSADDTLITDLIDAATKHVERITGWLTNPQSLQFVTRKIDRTIRLPHWPVSAVTAIQRVGTTTTSVLGLFDIDLTERPAKVMLVDPLVLGRGESIRISYTAGETVMPSELHQAVLMLVGHWYENREAAQVGSISGDVALGVNVLLSQFIGLRLS